MEITGNILDPREVEAVFLLDDGFMGACNGK
jgi:hypothetical protein